MRREGWTTGHVSTPPLNATRVGGSSCCCDLHVYQPVGCVVATRGVDMSCCPPLSGTTPTPTRDVVIVPSRSVDYPPARPPDDPPRTRVFEPAAPPRALPRGPRRVAPEGSSPRARRPRRAPRPTTRAEVPRPQCDQDRGGEQLPAPRVPRFRGPTERTPDDRPPDPSSREGCEARQQFARGEGQCCRRCTHPAITPTARRSGPAIPPPRPTRGTGGAVTDSLDLDRQLAESDWRGTRRQPGWPTHRARRRDRDRRQHTEARQRRRYPDPTAAQPLT